MPQVIAKYRAAARNATSAVMLEIHFISEAAKLWVKLQRFKKGVK